MTPLLSAKFEAAKEAWAARRARYADKLRPAKTISGLPVKTVYTPEDVADSDLEEMPGVYPFTRGLHPDGYALTPWMQQMVFGYGTIEETRQKMEKMVAEEWRDTSATRSSTPSTTSRACTASTPTTPRPSATSASAVCTCPLVTTTTSWSATGT